MPARMSAGMPAGGDLAGLRALVTGGAGGIGLACARRLAEAGAEVIIVDVREDGAREAAAEVAADLSDMAAVDALDCGDLDIVINNAGLQHVAPLPEFPPEVFAEILRIMVEAPFRLVRRALPGMYERGWGRVVNISSVHGLRASPYKAAYVTAKHALEGLSKVIALEGAEHGVTSNCVNPAYVRTRLVEDQIAGQARTQGLSPDQVVGQVMLAKAAIRRLIEPEEVAELVAYLCSPQAAMVTGASLAIDGGWSAH